MPRKIIFSFILVLFPVLIFFLLEVSLRLFNFGTDLSLFQKSELYPSYYEINKDMGKRYFRKLGATTPTNDIFLIEKPDTCYRIFVLGESTTRGFPYQSGTMFSRILYYRLQDAFPEKRIEVVNLSISAINSYAVRDMMSDVLNQKPDAILIYTGHNEYYGALGVGSVENGGNFMLLSNLQLKLIHVRTYQLVQQLISKIGNVFSDDKNMNRGGAMMEQIAKEKSIAYGSKVYHAGIRQFEKNLTYVLERAGKKNVPVILSELVNNIKDQQPFKSVSTETLPPAIDVYNTAKGLEAGRDFKQAKDQYYRAKDLDAIRFRSPEDFNNLLVRLGEKYKAPVVPMKKVFEENSPSGIIGNNLILEHLHPNIDGYFLMADAFFHCMKNNGFVSETWDTTKIKPNEFYRQNWGFTELDSLIGDLKIKMLKEGWPFKQENEVNIFLGSYRPKNLADSLAFRYVSNEDLHIEDQHVALADVFYQNGEYQNAFEEYKSLIVCYPYVNDLYYEASKFLIAEKKYQQAFDLIHSAPDLKKDYPYYLATGSLYLNMHQLSDAIDYFEQGRRLVADKEQEKKILKQLYLAYKSVDDLSNANQVYEQLVKLDPDFEKKQASASEDDLRIKKLTDEAIEHIKLKQYEDALGILFSANEIKETLLVNKMIGSLMFMLKDSRALDYYQKALLSSPNDPEILNNMFLLSLMGSDVGQAEYYLDKYRYVSSDFQKIKNLEGLLEKKKKELNTR